MTVIKFSDADLAELERQSDTDMAHYVPLLLAETRRLRAAIREHREAFSVDIPRPPCSCPEPASHPWDVVTDEACPYHGRWEYSYQRMRRRDRAAANVRLWDTIDGGAA